MDDQSIALMNELLERVGSDERIDPDALHQDVVPFIYTLFDRLLTRIERLEEKVRELKQDASDHVYRLH